MTHWLGEKGRDRERTYERENTVGTDEKGMKGQPLTIRNNKMKD